MTIAELIYDAEQRLSDAGTDTPRLDAEVLLAHVMGVKRVDLVMRRAERIDDGRRVHVDELIRRRERHEPVSHLIGSREFWTRTITVTPDVLTPRPETEGIVERATNLFDREARLHMLDLCTGSGCIAAALADEFPHARITATDVSAAALDVARANLAFAADRVELFQGDLFEALTNACHSRERGNPEMLEHGSRLSGRDDRRGNLFAVFGSRVTSHGSRSFDLIVSNPPYIPDGDMDTLPPEVRDHEPRAALAGGHDGLAILEQIAKNAASFLEAGGWLILEIGAGQADAVCRMIEESGEYANISVNRDLQGIERIVAAQKAVNGKQ